MVIQSKSDDCGKTAVRNLLTILFHDDGFECCFLNSECKDFYSMRKELERYDAIYASYQVSDLDEIPSSSFPSIAQIVQGEHPHFVIVKKISKNKVVVLDPAFGLIKFDRNEFLQLTTGYFLLKEICSKHKSHLSTNLYLKRETFLYVLCFLMQISSACVFVFFSSTKDGFVPLILSLFSLLLFIFVQNGLNYLVLERLQNKVLLPYMRESDNKEDFLSLSKVIQIQTSRKSKTLSYGVLLILFTFLFFLNSYSLSLLTLISMMFTLIRFPLLSQKAKINRYCSLKEREFLEYLKEDYSRSVKSFNQAKRKGKHYIFYLLISWIIQSVVIFILLLFIAALTKNNNFNWMLYYFGLVMTYSITLERLYQCVIEEEKEKTYINALSKPLSFFLLTKK